MQTIQKKNKPSFVKKYLLPAVGALGAVASIAAAALGAKHVMSGSTGRVGFSNTNHGYHPISKAPPQPILSYSQMYK
jgi:hypothetical protein